MPNVGPTSVREPFCDLVAKCDLCGVVGRIAHAVKDFFVWLAKAIWSCIVWIYDKICCCHCGGDDNPGDPGIAAAAIAARIAADRTIFPNGDAAAPQTPPSVHRARPDFHRPHFFRPPVPGAAQVARQLTFGHLPPFALPLPDPAAFPPEVPMEANAVWFTPPPNHPFWQPARPPAAAAPGLPAMRAEAENDRVEPATTQARKAAGLDRIQAIQAGLSRRVPIQFQVHPAVEDFDLDAVLAQFSNAKNPQRLMDFFNYVRGDTLPDQTVREFENVHYVNRTYTPRVFLQRCLRKYPPHVHGMNLTIRQYLSKLVDIFERKQARVQALGDPSNANRIDAEQELKEELRGYLVRIMDGHNGCGDQTIAQVEPILIDAVESELTQGNARQSKLQFKAAYVLFKYRAQLVTAILQQLYPNDPHAADLERVVKQKLARELGLRSALVQTGAVHPSVSGQEDIKTENIKNRFLRVYWSAPEDDEPRPNPLRNDQRPVTYLVAELKPLYGALKRSLREHIQQCAYKHFALDRYNNEDAPDAVDAAENTLTVNFVKALNQRQDADVEDSLTGDFSTPGVLFLLEAAGIVRQVH